MPENEFEKKVSSEMQKLKFAPSEKVWLRVEERIRKKNKRRVFVIIFLLAGLALLGYWQRSNLFGEKKTDIVKTEKQKEENPKISEETNNSPTTIQNTEAANQNEVKDANVTSNKESEENTKNKTETEKLTNEKTSVSKKNREVSGNKTPQPGKKERNISGPIKNETEIQPAQRVTTKVTDINAKIPGKNDTVVKTQDEVVQKNQPEIKQPELKSIDNNTDSIKNGIIQPKKNSIDTKDSVSKKGLSKDSAAVIVQKKPEAKKWKWELHFTPGISSLNGKSISFGSQRFAYSNNTQSSAGGPAGGFGARQKPSEVRSGFAFQVGGSAQRQLSSRTSFSLGLQYGYYSNRIGIGSRRDSLLNNSQFSNLTDENKNHVYNAGGDTIKFINQYHFLELPFNFQWQLNKNRAKPFIWSTGFTIGQLIASNALMYDTAFNGIYYKNKNLLNKTQFSLSTSVSWTIAKNKRAEWSLGPVADIHLNKLFDSPFENKKYLFFVGLRTAVLFDQKK